VIINASRNIAQADDHRTAAQELRDQINAVRVRLAEGGTQQDAKTATPATAIDSHAAVVQATGGRADGAQKAVNLATDSQGAGIQAAGMQRPAADFGAQGGDPGGIDELAAELYGLGAVKFGSFTLASGIQSPIYVDLRLLVSKPSLLARAAQAYYTALKDLPCERIAGVPYAALPIGTAVAIVADKPLIYLRKEVKSHGLGKLIEGVWQPGERVVVIEDLITSGGSTIETAEQLRAAGLVVEHVIVLIDREQGGAAKLAAAGIRAHSVFKLTDLLASLAAQGLLEPAKHQEVLAFLGK
jgi:orotate phosphoribosyltransferase